MTFKSINPYNGEVINSYTEQTETGIDEILAKSQQVFGEWLKVPIDDRSRMLENAAGLLRKTSMSTPEP